MDSMKSTTTPQWEITPDWIYVEPNALQSAQSYIRTNSSGEKEPTKSVSSASELKDLFDGYYDDSKSRCENIFRAIENGRFPTAYDVVLNEIPFEVPHGQIVILPDNVHLNGCTLTQGTLKFFSGKLTGTTAEAKPYALGNGEAHTVAPQGSARAEGPLAQAYAHNGRAYAVNQAKAYATGKGKAFATTPCTEAHADGEEACAFGMTFDTKVCVKNGATGYKNAEGVKVTGDSKSWVEWTVLNKKIPPCNHDSRFYNEAFKAHVLQLNDLALAGDKEAAFKLGMVHSLNLKTVFKIDKPRVLFLTCAHELGHKEAAFELGNYYMQRSKTIDRESDVRNAQLWYARARDEMQHPNAQGEIEYVESKLKFYPERTLGQKDNCLIS